MTRTPRFRTAVALGVAAAVLPAAAACGGGQPASSGSPSATSGTTGGSATPGGSAETTTVRQEQATTVGGLHIGVASVDGHTAGLQVVGPHVKYRVVTGKAGKVVKLPGHTLTIVAVHGSGSSGTVTVRVATG